MIIYQTKNFIFRQCKMSDVEYYLTFWNDPKVMKYIGDGSWGGGVEKVNYFLGKNISEYAKDSKFGFWCVIDKISNRVIGEAGLSKMEAFDQVEAGYILHQNYWGKGFGTEILSGLLIYGFEVIGLDTIITVAHPKNKGSIRVMEKCGMKYIENGYFHGRLSVKYSKDRQEHLTEI